MLRIDRTFGENNILVQGIGELQTLFRLLPRIVVEATFDVDAVLVTVEPDICIVVSISLISCLLALERTGHQNIPIMRHKILDDAIRAVLDVDVAPVHPAVLWLHGGIQKVVARLAHCLSPRALRRKSVSILHALRQLDAKVLLDDDRTAERDRVGSALDALQLFRQDGKSVVRAVADKEGQINQMVGVGELTEEIKVLFNVWSCVAKGSEDEDALFVVDGFGCRPDWVEVDVGDGALIDFNGFMVVEDDRSLKM